MNAFDPNTLPGDIGPRIAVTANGCWEWAGAHLPGGYGVANMNLYGNSGLLHRITYTLLVGPIAPGLQIDHLCRNRGCCNPGHLEPVTARENLLRGETAAARNARKTHCPNGHEYTPENVYVPPGTHTRQCRSCRRLREAPHLQRARYARRKAMRLATTSEP